MGHEIVCCKALRLVRPASPSFSVPALPVMSVTLPAAPAPNVIPVTLRLPSRVTPYAGVPGPPN